jgi:hypothetical protein
MRRLNSADLPTFGRPTITTFGSVFAPFTKNSPDLEFRRMRMAFGLQLPDAVGDVNDP